MLHAARTLESDVEDVDVDAVRGALEAVIRGTKEQRGQYISVRRDGCSLSLRT